MKRFIWPVLVLGMGAAQVGADPMEVLLTYYDPDVPGHYHIFVRNDRFAVRYEPADFGVPDSNWVMYGLWSSSGMYGKVRVAICEDDTSNAEWEHFPGDTIQFLEYFDPPGGNEEADTVYFEVEREDNRPYWVYYDYSAEGIPFRTSGTEPPFGRNIYRNQSLQYWQSDIDDWAIGILARFEPAVGIGPESEPPRIPRALTLHQNYPNPFNPSTTIALELPRLEFVTLRIFDLRGQLVRTLTAGEKEAGRHELHWNGTDELGKRVSSGNYLFRLETGHEVRTRKMVLAK